ncbi:hypothetical protein RCH07_002629 [Arthrobacter sp. CG_A4]|nr:hypothetical protein [Arthrobacter sp. CG_A4]
MPGSLAHGTQPSADWSLKVPAPLVAEMLGYSYQVAQKHAAAAAEPWSRYPGNKPDTHND